MRARAALGLLLVALAPDAGFAGEDRPSGNRTPKSHVASAFESYVFQSPDNGWPEFLAALSGQGYVVQRFKNDSFDDDPEGATIANLVAAGQSGVLALLHIHGSATGTSLEVYKKETVRDLAWDAYIAAGWNQDAIEIIKADFSSGSYGIRAIRMQAVGYANRIKPQTDALDTIGYAGGVCNSVGFIDDMGGRVGFANDGLPDFWFHNVAEWLAYMSGAKGAGDYRPAGDAVTIGDYDPVVRIVGETSTTLCPTVLAHAPVGEFDCPAGRATGTVSFDTRLDDTVAAASLIEISPGATLAEATWLDPGFEIRFEVEDIDDGETVTVGVRGDQARSAANGTPLDGNQVPAGTDGTLPSGDDFAWSFSGVVDRDGDGLRDLADRCPTLFNPDQEPVAFVEALTAPAPDQLVWLTPADVDWVRGPLAGVAAYGVEASGSLAGATALDLSADSPDPDAGFYYLVKHGGDCGLWASGSGDAGRDVALP